MHAGVRWLMLGGALHFALHAHPALANPMGAQVVAGGEGCAYAHAGGEVGV